MAIGDAAFALDPASGQGLAEALLSARGAVRAAERLLSGELGAIEGYAQERAQAFAAHLAMREATYRLAALRFTTGGQAAPFWTERSTCPQPPSSPSWSAGPPAARTRRGKGVDGG